LFKNKKTKVQKKNDFKGINKNFLMGRFHNAARIETAARHSEKRLAACRRVRQGSAPQAVTANVFLLWWL